MKINNIDELRACAIDTIHSLKRKKIDINEAGIYAKLFENLISTLKVQIEHNRMTGSSDAIPFISEAKHTKVVNGKVNNKLLGKSK